MSYFVDGQGNCEKHGTTWAVVSGCTGCPQCEQMSEHAKGKFYAKGDVVWESMGRGPSKRKWNADNEENAKGIASYLNANKKPTYEELQSQVSLALTALEGAASLSDLEISLDNALERGDGLKTIQCIQKNISQVNTTIATALKTLRGEK